MKLKMIALILAVALCLGLLAGCGDNGAGTGGEKVNAAVILVLEDESEVKYDLNVTDGLTLREALYEAELISEETYYAMFVDNIDGHIADTMNDGVMWMTCDANGNQIQSSGDVLTPFDSIIIEDGLTIRLVYYVVPDFD